MERFVIFVIFYDILVYNYEMIIKNVLKDVGCLDVKDKVVCFGKLSGFDFVNLLINV